ncbi:hypothetical protein ACIQWN_21990 [Streptomyces vinaceus]|uniref:hypothetical protein n=1 Tax=Streptomyces vinaceus TaxID=1960 RepID=UPI0037F2A376
MSHPAVHVLAGAHGHRGAYDLAAAPGAPVGHAHLPAVTAGRAAAARDAVEAAHRAAARP